MLKKTFNKIYICKWSILTINKSIKINDANNAEWKSKIESQHPLKIQYFMHWVSKDGSIWNKVHYYIYNKKLIFYKYINIAHERITHSKCRDKFQNLQSQGKNKNTANFNWQSKKNSKCYETNFKLRTIKHIQQPSS